jgi:hypothetical protein
MKAKRRKQLMKLLERREKLKQRIASILIKYIEPRNKAQIDPYEIAEKILKEIGE